MSTVQLSIVNIVCADWNFYFFLKKNIYAYSMLIEKQSFRSAIGLLEMPLASVSRQAFVQDHWY